MEKIKSYKIEVYGAKLYADIYQSEEEMYGKIHGDIFGMAQVIELGEDVKNIKHETYGPIELSAKSEEKLIEDIKSKIKSDFRKIIRFEEITSIDHSYRKLQCLLSHKKWYIPRGLDKRE